VPDAWRAPEGRAYRAHPHRPGVEPLYTDDRGEAEIMVEMWRAEGLPAEVERYVEGCGYSRASSEPVTVRQLAREGLARETSVTIKRPDGTSYSQTRWVISPEGQRRINEGMGL
jgi:hypothetical protein